MTRFAVAAGHELTAEAAAEVLRAGGNAVDAVIAAALAACVVEPALTSFFGGGFMMVREADGRTRLLDFFVQTPKRKSPASEVDFRAVEADFGTTRQMFHIGAGAIAAPGVARGFVEAHRRLGAAPFADIVQPAIRLAHDGAVVTEFQAKVMGIISAIFHATPESMAVYGREDRLPHAGEVLGNTAFADVLEVYAHEGDRFIQEGEVAQALLSLDGGHLTAADLKDYRAVWREPLEETRAGARLSLNPPPSLGGVLIAFALRMMKEGAGPADVAMALAATSRARLETDLNHHPAEGAARLLAPDLAERYRRELAGRRASVLGTTHISVMDGHGMGAAVTMSNGAGGGLIAPGTGIMPNNMLGEEDLVAGGLGEWATDIRLSSMMAPIAVQWPDGTAAMLGTGGSNRIRSALSQVAARLIDGGGALDEAIAAPRIHVEGPAEPKVDAEDRFSAEERERLLAVAPEATMWPEDSMFFGGVHAVRRAPSGVVEAAGDARRHGAAIVG